MMIHYRNIIIVSAYYWAPYCRRPARMTRARLAPMPQNSKKFLQACIKKADVKHSYTSLLDSWLRRYQELPDSARKQYVRYLANAQYDLACAYALAESGAACTRSPGAGYQGRIYQLRAHDAGCRPGKHPAKGKVYLLLQPLRATGDYLYILGRAKTPTMQGASGRCRFSRTRRPAILCNLVAFSQGL